MKHAGQEALDTLEELLVALRQHQSLRDRLVFSLNWLRLSRMQRQPLLSNGCRD